MASPQRAPARQTLVPLQRPVDRGGLGAAGSHPAEVGPDAPNARSRAPTARPANLLPTQNWKCNGTVESVKQLVQDLNAGGCCCPPYSGAHAAGQGLVGNLGRQQSSVRQRRPRGLATHLSVPLLSLVCTGNCDHRGSSMIMLFFHQTALHGSCSRSEKSSARAPFPTSPLPRCPRLRSAGSVPATVDVVVAPTFVHLDMVKRELRGPVQIAAQDCWTGAGGAFTGEVSAEMLRDFGIPWVILGHSGACGTRDRNPTPKRWAQAERGRLPERALASASRRGLAALEKGRPACTRTLPTRWPALPFFLLRPFQSAARCAARTTSGWARSASTR